MNNQNRDTIGQFAATAHAEPSLELSNITAAPEDDDWDDDYMDRCRECGADNTGGDGYDGLCGNCADVAFGDEDDDYLEPESYEND
jgi:hypothetical protein